MRLRAAEREGTMHVVIRSYAGQGASELFDALVEREQDVKDLISSVPGFISYEALRSDGGGQTVTACQGKAGTDEVVAACRPFGSRRTSA